MQPRSASEYALLGALITGPRHGYEILTFLGEGLAAIWRIPTSQLYAQLKRLEEQGRLRSSLEEQETRPSKRVFEITDEGRKAFGAWVLTPCRHVRDLRVEFLAKLFFIRMLGMDGSSLLQGEEEMLDRTLACMGARIEKETDPHKRLAIGFKRATAAAWLRWLQEEARPFIEENRST